MHPIKLNLEETKGLLIENRVQYHLEADFFLKNHLKDKKDITVMKRIKQYRKLFNVEKDTDLKQLKKTYRGLVKQWHPDKFQDETEKAEAEAKSTEIIDGYHFLVSINPETKAAGLEEYKNTLETCGISDYHHKGMVLEIIFTNGATYEYFGMTKPVFQKMINSGKPLRFAKRNVFGKMMYRKSKRDEVAV